MLGHAGGDVGVMVLDANGRNPFPFRPRQRIAGGQIIGMQIVGNQFRLDAEQLFKMVNPILK